MTLANLTGLAFILLFSGLILAGTGRRRGRTASALREIPAFTKLRRGIGLAVEAGSRLHVSIGRGSIIGTRSASALVGLSILERLARSTSTGDSPPVATAGDASLGVLAQDAIKGAQQQVGINDPFDPATGQVAGLSPFSYAAGALSMAQDERTGANILVGSFGPEVVLLTDAGERSGHLTLGGTDNIPGQAVIYATAHEPLVGEELYAGGAYLQAGPMHTASLRAQDAIRWLLIGIILIGLALKTLGLDTALIDFLRGLL